MPFRCRQSHNSTKGKTQQVTEVRKNVKPEIPSLFLPYCLSAPSSFSIQKAHERKKKKNTLVSFIIYIDKSIPQIENRQKSGSCHGINFE